MQIKEEIKKREKSGKSYSSPAVEQAGRILFCLANDPSRQMGLMDICRQVGVSGSKAYGILEALQKSGLVKRGKNGKGYSLGQGLVTLSRKFLDDLVPSDLAEHILEKLTKETDRTSVFGIIMNDIVTITAKYDREGNIIVGVPVGRTMPVTQGAHGKAVTAFLPEDEQKIILRNARVNFHGAPERLNMPRLIYELNQCREQGFACDMEESIEGVNVVAAPVIGPTGTPIGFVEIFDLSSAERAREFGPAVAEAGRRLSRELGANIG